MQNYDFWFWEQCLNEKQISQINEVIDSDNLGMEDESNSAYSGGKNLKTSIVKVIQYGKIKHFVESIVRNCYTVNEFEYGFDLYPLYDEEIVNLNVYSGKQQASYDWHIDASKNTNYDLKFTILVNISQENYTGGDFQIFNTKENTIEQINTTGNVIMFKSFLSHRVLPVTRGERRTLAIFIRGPRFK